MSAESLGLAAIVVVAQAVETVAGFGGTVISLSLGVHFLPLERLVVALVLLGWLQSAWLVARNRAHVDRSLLFSRILPLAGAGMAAGTWAFSSFGHGALRLLLGGFVVVMSGLELARLLRGVREAPPRLPAPVGALVVLGGGFFHGLFATGGPLIVFFASREVPEKARFRATLSALWLIMNTALLAHHAHDGRLDADALMLSATALPALALGIALGERLHARVDELSFRRLSQGLLLCTGVLLLVR